MGERGGREEGGCVSERKREGEIKGEEIEAILPAQIDTGYLYIATASRVVCMKLPRTIHDGTIEFDYW